MKESELIFAASYVTKQTRWRKVIKVCAKIHAVNYILLDDLLSFQAKYLCQL